jgi:hypothetical protein
MDGSGIDRILVMSRHEQESPERALGERPLPHGNPLRVRGRVPAEEGGFAWQTWIDTTPGAPPYIRRQALRKALGFCGPERLLFGSDPLLPGSLSRQREVLDADLAICRDCGLSDGQIEGILSGNALRLFPAQG